MAASRIPSPKSRPSTPKRASTPAHYSPSAAGPSSHAAMLRSAASSPPTFVRQVPSSSGTTPVVSPGKRGSVGSFDGQRSSLSRSSSSSSSIPGSAMRHSRSSSPQSSRASSQEYSPAAGTAVPPADFVQAAYDFSQPDDPTYLSFRKGQLIRVVSKDESGWWNGELEGRQAWFPSNYIISISSLPGDPSSANMTRAGSTSSSTSRTSSVDSPTWDRRPSEASSVASASTFASSSAEGYDDQSTKPGVVSHERDPGSSRRSSRQGDGRPRRVSIPSSPPRTSHRPSEAKTPPRHSASRNVSASSTRGTSAILDSITTAVSLLHSAVSAERISHFNPSTACVISSVRSVLSATDCLPKDSPLLKRHPALARERKTILAELSKLVGQSRIASAGVLPEGCTRADEMDKMLSMARRLLAGVKSFLAIAVESGIDLPDHAGSTVDSSDVSDTDEDESESVGRRLQGARTVTLAAAPPDLDRTPTAPGARRDQLLSQGPASGRRLMDVLDQVPSESHDASASNGVSGALASADAAHPSKSPSTPAADEVEEAKAAHEELLVIISAFIGQVYSPSRTEETAMVAHLLEVAHESLLCVLRLLSVVDGFHPRLRDVGSLEQLGSARSALVDATTGLVTAAEELGASSSDGSSPESDNDCRIKLLSGATSTLRGAASCAKVVAQVAPLADAVDLVVGLVAPEDCASLQRRGAELMSLRDRLDRSRTIAASQGNVPRAPAFDRRSVDSTSIASSIRSDSGEDFTIRATPPPRSEMDNADDLDLEGPIDATHTRPSSLTPSTGRADSVGTDGAVPAPGARRSPVPLLSPSLLPHLAASLSLSTQTASTDVTLASPRGSTDGGPTDASPPLVRSSSASSLEETTVVDVSKEPASSSSVASALSGLPPQAQGSIPELTLKSLDNALELPIPRPEAFSDGRFWLLGHDYDPTDLALSSEGHLIGASLPALVEKLTPHDTAIVDPALVDMFFLCFRLFVTPVELFEALVQRFRMEGPAVAAAQAQDYVAWMHNKVAPVRIRIFGFLKLWLDSHWQTDADAEVLPLLESFAGGLLKDALPSVAPRLLHAIRQRSQPSSPEPRVTPTRAAMLHKAKSTDRLRSGIPRWEGSAPDLTLPPTPQIARGLFQALRNQTAAVVVTDFDPLELARQLTVMESKLFNAVKAHDVLASHKQSSPALKAMSSFNTHLTSLVSDTILTERDVKKRSATLKFFIKLANRLLDIRNFSSAFAVVASLNGSSITRLKKTWDALSSKAKLSIATLRDLFDSSRNHANYRARLRECNPPALPFLGIILSDVTFCFDGNQNTRRSPLAPDKQLINLSKYNALWKLVSDMRRFQVPFALAEVPEVQVFLSKVFAEKESTSMENLYRKSLSIEPRTSTTSATHP